MSNRAERRRMERENRKDTTPIIKSEIQNAVSESIERYSEHKKARDEAALLASGPVLKAIYAGMISVLSEDYGFDEELCYDVLNKVDEKAALCLESEDLVKEAFEKTGIQIRLGDAFYRIERKDIRGD